MPGVHFLRVVKGRGCSSYIGSMEFLTSLGYQDISLDSSCLVVFNHSLIFILSIGFYLFQSGLGIPLHEIGHSLGFYHEQSRPDRDNYITVNLNNIQSSDQFNFLKYSTADINSYDTSYDFASDMHYSGYVSKFI